MRQQSLTMLIVLITVPSASGQLPGRFVNPQKILDLDTTLESPGISLDGLTMYFMSRAGGFGGPDLYRATRSSVDDMFSNPVNLGAGVNTDSVENKPFVTPDGLTLYFHSNREEGFGGADIYVATRASKSDAFGRVANLGSEINSPQTDAGPFLSSNGTELYFHSDRDGVIGSRSIFRATRTQSDETFSNVSLIESNINAESWDGDVSLSSDGLTMFFNSTRPHFQLGGGDLKLYVAQRTSIDAAWGDATDLNDFGLGSELNLPSSWTFHPEISANWPAPDSRIYYVVGARSNDYEIYQATWQPAPIPGDFNADFIIDSADADILSEEIRSRGSNQVFDLTNDGTVNLDDHAFWVGQIAGTWYGDANLDGEFDSHDFVSVFQRGEYEDGITWNSSWATGDWNGDGEFDSADFVVAFQDGGYENGLRPIAVPEAALSIIGVWCFLYYLARNRWRQRQLSWHHYENRANVYSGKIPAID